LIPQKQPHHIAAVCKQHYYSFLTSLFIKMADGAFVRLNGSMVQGSSMGDGQIISVIGRMESTNGANMVVSASDGVPLTYSMPTEIDFSQVRLE
jgi:hypothetical protein